MSARRAALSSATSLAAALMSTLAMIVASRRGMFVDIASYASGASATAVASVLLGGGTTLNYLTGGDAARRAVRRIRYRVVLPGLVLCALLVSVVGSKGGLTMSGVLLGGLFVAFNNMGELASAELQRRLETPRVLLGTIAGRTLTLVAVALGAKFSLGAALGAALTCLLLMAFARGSSAGDSSANTSFRNDLREAFTGRTVSLALFDAVAMKVPFLVAPVVLVSSLAAGHYSTLLSAQQSLLAVMTAPLYSAMANASGQGRRAWASRLESMIVWVSLGCGLGGSLLSGLALRLLGIPLSRQFWLILLMVCVPVTVWNRSCQYRFMAAMQLDVAARLMAVVALGAVAGSLIAYGGGSVWLAAAPLAGEVCGTIYLLGRKIQSKGDRID